MVIEVDLSKDKTVEKKEDTLDANERRKSFIRRIKAKVRIWQLNFARMPFIQKLLIFSVAILFTGLVSVAIVYSFVILSTPAHEPIDTSYILLEASKNLNTYIEPELPPPPEIKDHENPVNGELYTKEEFEQLNKRKALAVIIENHTDARPQAGLTDADLVYETLAESGITRFMAIYWGNEAKKLGPIRSLRTYFLDWSAEYDDPPICNIGQAGYESWEDVIVPEADARSYIINYNVKSFSWYGRNVTWRDQEKYRQGKNWEHVAYSSTEKLWEDAEIMEWNGPSSITTYKYKKDIIKAERPLSSKIEIKFLNLGADTYKVKWVYNKDSNTYSRFQADEAHIDENNNKQISAKNIIIQHCQYRPTGDRNGRIVFTTVGEGDAQIIRDGKIIEGTWKKEDRTSRTIFYTSKGKEVELNRGQIWIEIVPVGGTTELSKITIE